MTTVSSGVVLDKDLLHNRIVRDIIGSIFSGTYKTGEKLPTERALSQSYDVSRGTIREALAALQKLGIVAVRHGSGIYVQQISGAAIPNQYLPPDFEHISLEDILVARKAIEQAAIELACAAAEPEELAAMESLVEKMGQSIDDLPAFLHHDMEFHQALVSASGNRALVRAFEALHEYHRYSQVFTTQKAGDEAMALKFHKQILKGLQGKNAAACRKAIEEHLNSMSESVGKEKE
jgi:DNA-binding FadR family transcriptional regulator